MTTTLAPVFEGFKLTEVAEINAYHEARLVTITNPRGRRYTTLFKGDEPTVEAVLEELVTDAAAFNATQGFEEWAREENISWKTRAERKAYVMAYRRCERRAAKVETFFTSKELFLITEVIDY